MEIIEEKQSDINIFKLNGRLDSNTSQDSSKSFFRPYRTGQKTWLLTLRILITYQVPVYA
jgi:hypothetical protein